MNHAPRWIWSTPRSVSTALERCMLNVPGLSVDHEPYTEAYYFGDERRSDRYGADPSGRDPVTLGRAGIGRRLSARCKREPLLIKELAFQGEPYVSDALLRGSRTVVLTRDPRKVYASLVRLKPDFSDEEFGFTALLRIARRLERLGSEMLLVDGDDLQRRPADTVSRVCDFLELPYSPDLLRWQDGRIREWRSDERSSQALWHGTLERSHGLVRTRAPATAIPAERESLIASATEVYARLRELCYELSPYEEAV